MKSSGNTILITGGTSGIGRGLALRFEALGNTVIVAGRRTELLDDLTAEHPTMSSIVLDVADPASITAAAETVKTTYPDVNVLINVAGIMLPENLHSAEFLPTAESIVATNLLGPIRLISALTEFLQAKDDAVIMNVSSGLAFVPLAFTPTYSATKAAIHSFTESLRVQLADTSVEVLELAPPAVQTALMGQDESGRGMTLDAFLTEAMSIIVNQPDAREILVDEVKPLRFAEARGTYDQVLQMLAAH